MSVKTTIIRTIALVLCLALNTSPVAAAVRSGGNSGKHGRNAAVRAFRAELRSILEYLKFANQKVPGFRLTELRNRLIKAETVVSTQVNNDRTPTEKGKLKALRFFGELRRLSPAKQMSSLKRQRLKESSIAEAISDFEQFNSFYHGTEKRENTGNVQGTEGLKKNSYTFQELVNHVKKKGLLHPKTYTRVVIYEQVLSKNQSQAVLKAVTKVHIRATGKMISVTFESELNDNKQWTSTVKVSAARKRFRFYEEKYGTKLLEKDANVEDSIQLEHNQPQRAIDMIDLVLRDMWELKNGGSLAPAKMSAPPLLLSAVSSSPLPLPESPRPSPELDRNQLLLINRDLATRIAGLEKKLEEKDKFLQAVTHDIRTPLTTIMGFTQFLLNDNTDEKRTKYLKSIMSQAGVIDSYVQDLVDIAMKEAGKLTMDKKEFDFPQMVSKLVDGLQYTAARKRIQLLINALPNGILVYGDSNRLFRVLQNLITNAIKYTQAGGKVELQMQQEAGHITVAVKDTGEGLDPTDIKKIFDTFYQVERAGKGIIGGWGMGLSIAMDFVKAHDGQLWAESPGKGQGSTFFMKIPSKANLAAVPMPAAPLVLEVVDSDEVPRPEPASSLSHASRSELLEKIQFLKNLVEGLQQQVEELLDKDRRKDEALATVAHDLGNPLALIQQYINVVKNKSASEQVEALPKITKKVEIAFSMISIITDVSKAKAGKLIMNKNWFDFSKMVTELITDLTHKANANNIQLTLEELKQGVQVYGDPIRLMQVLQNLVNNAIKFTPKGGSVLVKVHQAGKHVVASVTDNGQGVDPSDIDKIFDTNYQTKQLERRENKGWGMGLYIAKAITQAHDGTLRATSQGKGKGSTFFMKIASESKDEEN